MRYTAGDDGVQALTISEITTLQRPITASAATVVQRNFIDDFTSAGNVASDALSGIEHVGTIVTSVAGHDFTLLTADGGHVLTLAASGEGIATSIAGTLYTIATADVGNALNGALSLPGPLLGGFLTASVSMMLGAFMIF
ncbi:hypothetical protein GSI_06111 [Ganoderma sinense ZZ0214-1]|uniref:Uncharacterized protein n=1 Tax=Ganoderma sinense ZZ0214-1 TaxID=1077348 RepID=A0A2G8SCC3_9APHY|nr:hypothetical protein GSI_06111 [Ganoderma sinense ZZ0214-1]